jgi:WD40 repeat protein
VLATGSYDDTVRLWDITSPDHPSAKLTGHTDTVFSVAFSPDGHTLASVSRDNNVRLWDVGEPMVTVGSASVSISPDGRTLSAGGYLNAVLWNIADPLHPSKTATLSGHTDGVAAKFSPDGHYLATASLDTTVRLWDVTDPQHPNELATLTDHTGNVFAAVFSPDGHPCHHQRGQHSPALGHHRPTASQHSRDTHRLP